MAKISKTAARLMNLSLVLVALCAVAVPAFGQSYEVLHAFMSPGGGSPGGPVVSVGGVLYGTTQYGGAWGRGSVFSLAPDGSGGFTFATLHSFIGPDGAGPRTNLVVGADGNLYGTTFGGGAAGAGTVFRITASGSLTRLHDFADGGGRGPHQLVLASDGGLYGTASAGGDHGGGTVYRIGPDEAFSTVHSFDGASEGTAPILGLLQVGADLYGTTSAGGAGGVGTIFRLDFAGHLTTIHDFSGADGAAPTAALIQGSDGNLYGTTSQGGAHSGGTVFRVDLSGDVTTLHSFQTFLDGAVPTGLLQASDGKFYGATAFGGPGSGKDMFPAGVVFRIDTDGNFQLLYGFLDGPHLGTPGAYPLSALAVGPDGFLYGTTSGQGAGTVYRIGLVEGLSYVHFFGSDGGAYGPVGRLTEVGGSLYGVTQGNGGTIYRLDGPDPTVLHRFSGADGVYPSDLLLGSDGNLYGTTTTGGDAGYGTAFRLGLPDTFEVLHAFGFFGAYPLGGLTEGSDGSFYGTTRDGGQGAGTAFHMDAAGEVTTLHEFALGFLEGSYPQAPPIRASNGTLYGTTPIGGEHAYGALYAIDSLGTFSVFHSFEEHDGASPVAALLQGSDGALYGTTPQGGAPGLGFGNVFRIDTTGNIATLHDFAGPDGAAPKGVLIEGPQGLYGTTANGGSAGQGTLFRIDLTGSLETLYDLVGADGSGPSGTLLAASDGALYGTAGGGLLGGGVVFRLRPDSPAPAPQTIQPSSGRASGGTPITVVGDGLYSVNAVSIGGAAATPLVVPDQGRIFSISPALAPGALHDVTVTAPGAVPAVVSQTLPAAWFADFSDVPQSDLFHSYVESIVRAGITAGCGGGAYCRDQAVRRDQMAVFLLKAEHGGSYSPPPCIGSFPDVACPGPFSDWIEQLAAEGVTAGCGGGNYCPGEAVTRRQMAVFLLKAKEGAGYAPAAAAGIFDDVPASDPFAPWIEELANRQITAGCQVSPLLYCPAAPNTRGQMAVFLVKTFGLP